MKRKITLLMGAVLMGAVFLFGSKTVVQASGDYTNPELTLTRVADINVFNDYLVNNIQINTTFSQNHDGGQVYKFTIEEDGFVSLLITARQVKKITEKNFKASTSDATLSATIYRDKGLLYGVSPKISAVGNVKGESPNKIALDKGTYYISVNTDKYVNENNTVISVLGTGELIVYYQQLPNNETIRPSNVGNENELKIEDEFKGLLTSTNPKDYYKFEIKEKALLKINAMYGSKNSMKFSLYSPEREELLTKVITGNSIWYNVEKFLEPGIYYCSLETLTAFDGGQTNLLINQTTYPLVLEQRNGSVNSYITVETIDNPMEIRYVLGKLTNSELTSAKWNKGKVITEDLQFGVNKLGYYTVRVTDEYGNMFMQSIRVTSCDKTAPKQPTVKSYSAGAFIVSGTGERNSLVTVSVNGKPYLCTANTKGSYKCSLPFVLKTNDKIEVTSQDISGNVSEKAEVAVK